MSGFAGFAAVTIAGDDGSTVFVRHGGSGPALLLLHGFPQTHLMWRDIAHRLATGYTVICADLRGYGASGCPRSAPDHASYAKRAMADELVGVMVRSGFQRFAVVGHDRGGRVAYRMALDHPDRVAALATLDIVPGEDAWSRADDRFALGYWPWSLLAQDPPLPEHVLTKAAAQVVDAALAGWGSSPAAFPDEVRRAYATMLADPTHAHAICEEYRAAAGLDRAHDRADRAAGRTIACPTLTLWSASGPLDQWYAEAGGPLALWRAWAPLAEGEAVPGGHFFPEEHPVETADRLAAFLARALG